MLNINEEFEPNVTFHQIDHFCCDDGEQREIFEFDFGNVSPYYGHCIVNLVKSPETYNYWEAALKSQNQHRLIELPNTIFEDMVVGGMDDDQVNKLLRLIKSNNISKSNLDLIFERSEKCLMNLQST